MSFSPIHQESPEATSEESSGIRMNLKSSFDSLIENKVDSMKVYCRVRPMLQSEEDFGYTECIAAISDQVVRAIAPSSSVKFKNTSSHGQEIMEDFKYTLAFGPEVGQFSFFQETIMDIMQGFIEGQNGLIFSYGITNSGKTYTLQGDDANPGIIPLSLHLFFACVERQLLTEISVKPDKYSEIVVLNPNERAKEQRLKEQLLQIMENEPGNKSDSASSTKSFGMTLCDAFYDSFKFEERQTTLPPEEMMAAQSALYMKELGKKSAEEQAGLCSIWVSFIEIYNEYIYDLLQPNVLQRQKLNLAEDQNGDVYVKGAREICVSSSEEAIKLLNLGRRNLRIASTKLNYQSSRSHCIYTLKVVRLFDEENSCGRVNRISFCDLAGSERAAKSQTSGLRLKEAGYINTSLLVLGRCLDQLRLNQTSRDKKMIPYRESKLTRLFYSHFLGKGKATMIANASPCEQTYDETLNVLRFSAHAKELTLNDSYVSMAFSSLQNLTTQWGQSRTRSIADASADQSTDFDTSLSCEIQEKDEIIEKLFDLADNLTANLKKEKKEKAELEIVLRQEICNEFSALSDKLLENQRNISEQRIESIKKNCQTRLENMEKMYQDKIKELTSQLEEFEACSDESINQSVDEKNEKSLFEIGQKEEFVQSPQIDHDLKKQDKNISNGKYEELVSKVAELSQALEEQQLELEIATEALKEQKSKFTELELECTGSKNENIKLLEEYSCMKEKLSSSLKELENKEEENNKNKSIMEKYAANLNEMKIKFDGLTSQLEESTRLLENERLTLQLECSKYRNECEEKIEEHESLRKEFTELKEELNAAKLQNENLIKEKSVVECSLQKALSEIQERDASDATNELKIQLEESNRTVDTQKLKINELENKCNDLCSKLEIVTCSLEKEKSTCEELTLSLQSDLSALKAEFDEKKDELDALYKENEQLRNEKINEESHATDLAELQTTLELSEKQVAELNETIKVYESEIAKLKKDMENLEAKQEILDLKRQVKEKEASIEELEKAISDDQKVKKENEAKLQQQISSLKHQHSIEIEEIMHLKRICEEENIKLKSSLAQAENQKDDKSNEQKIDAKSKSKTKKGGTKKVEASKEENEGTLNKEVTQRRRPLRSKAAQAFEEVKDEADDDFDDDVKPTRGLRKRKSDEKEYKPVVKKTKKRLEGNDENMSPVQKAISYVGAKFRSVAQSVNNVPSPRVTRGRKKLFNVEAGPSLAPWK